MEHFFSRDTMRHKYVYKNLRRAGATLSLSANGFSLKVDGDFFIFDDEKRDSRIVSTEFYPNTDKIVIYVADSNEFGREFGREIVVDAYSKRLVSVSEHDFKGWLSVYKDRDNDSA